MLERTTPRVVSHGLKWGTNPTSQKGLYQVEWLEKPLASGEKETPLG